MAGDDLHPTRSGKMWEGSVCSRFCRRFLDVNFKSCRLPECIKAATTACRNTPRTLRILHPRGGGNKPIEDASVGSTASPQPRHGIPNHTKYPRLFRYYPKNETATSHDQPAATTSGHLVLRVVLPHHSPGRSLNVSLVYGFRRSHSDKPSEACR